MEEIYNNLTKKIEVRKNTFEWTNEKSYNI